MSARLVSNSKLTCVRQYINMGGGKNQCLRLKWKTILDIICKQKINILFILIHVLNYIKRFNMLT